MTHISQSPVWRAAAICVGGSIALVALSLACFRLGFSLATAGYSMLILIALMALLRSFVGSVVLSLVAFACLSYYFASPVFSFWIASPADLAALVAFLTTSVIITGLTARVQEMAQTKLEQTRAELNHFARVATLGELTASIVHEVNQPLAGVVSSGNACQRWLASNPPNIERAAQSLERIVRDANRASEVVARVRSLAKKTPAQKSPVDVNAAVLEVVALTRLEIERGQVALTTELADGLPVVQADRIQLQQVLLNLIINAIESMAASGKETRNLSIATARDGAGGVVLRVGDTGRGLDSDALHHIFDAFYTTKQEGMGMGLAVSRAIVEAHGGRLWAAPNTPRGALFQFTLPAGA